MRSEINLDHNEDEKKYVELNLSGNRNSYNKFPTVLNIMSKNLSTKEY